MGVEGDITVTIFSALLKEVPLIIIGLLAILILLVWFLSKQAQRVLDEHRDMRKRLVELEAKIVAYENLGVMHKIWIEMRGIETEIKAGQDGGKKDAHSRRDQKKR